MRNRAGIIMWCKPKKQLLLIKRIKNGSVYYVVPGGGVKDGETFETAAKRELNEETGVCAGKIKEFVTVNTDRGLEKYYISTVSDTCYIKIHGEEQSRQNDSNQYIPRWIYIDKLNCINLLPAELKEFIKLKICI